MARLLAWTGSARGRSLAGLGCLALMLAAANILAAHYLPGRLDLTADRLYTLSDDTRRALARIDEPITLRFYHSPRLGETAPAYAAHAQHVRRLLGEYVAASPGKVRLEIEQPEPFAEAEDRAIAFGLRGVPLNAKGEQVYFGLVGTNSTDDQQVIPFFAPERETLLEYDLTRLVHALVLPAAQANFDELRDRGMSARRLDLLDRLRRAPDDSDAAKERALEARLREAQAKLGALTAGQALQPNAPLSPEQAGVVEQFRAEIAATRRQLRDMQAARRRDVERLKAAIEFVDIALVPTLVVAIAILLGARRRRRRRLLAAM